MKPVNKSHKSLMTIAISAALLALTAGVSLAQDRMDMNNDDGGGCACCKKMGQSSTQS